MRRFTGIGRKKSPTTDERAAAHPAKTPLEYLREQRKQYEERSRELDKVQTKHGETSTELYGLVKSSPQDERAQLYGATKVSALEGEISAKANQQPWLEFGKIFDLPEGEEYGPEYLLAYKQMEGSLLEIIGGRQEVRHGTKEYEAFKDLQYLKRTFFAFKLKDEQPQGRPYLIAKHDLDGISSMFDGTYKNRAGEDRKMSGTIVWSGEKGQNVPCSLYMDDVRHDYASFGVVYDDGRSDGRPNRVKISQGDFYAQGSFGEVVEDIHFGSSARDKTRSGEVIVQKTKYNKPKFRREVKYTDGSKSLLSLTDHSIWSSREKNLILVQTLRKECKSLPIMFGGDIIGRI